MPETNQLVWREPAAFRRSAYCERERAEPLHSAKFALQAFACILALRLLAGMRPAPGSHPPGWGATAIAAAALALFAAYGLPFLMSLMRGSIVVISAKGINNNRLAGLGWSIRFWPWEAIGSVESAITPVGGRDYETVMVRDRRGEVLAVLATAEEVPMSRIRQAVEANGGTWPAE